MSRLEARKPHAPLLVSAAIFKLCQHVSKQSPGPWGVTYVGESTVPISLELAAALQVEAVVAG